LVNERIGDLATVENMPAEIKMLVACQPRRAQFAGLFLPLDLSFGHCKGVMVSSLQHP
jgi:hypothetical protein